MMSIFDSLVPLFLIPFIGFFILMFSKNNLREIALGVATLEFLESLRLWSKFDYGSADFQFSFKVYWMTDYGFFFGLDGISLFFVVLTTFLIPICLLASWDTILILRKEYLLCFIGMLFLLMGVFTILDLLGFYMFSLGSKASFFSNQAILFAR